MFWSAQAVKDDVSFVGLLAPSLQATMIRGGGMIYVVFPAPQRRFKYKKLRRSEFCRSAIAEFDQEAFIPYTKAWAIKHMVFMLSIKQIAL